MSIFELTRSSPAQGEAGGSQPGQEWGGTVWWARLLGKSCSLQGLGSGLKHLVLQEAADRPGSSGAAAVTAVFVIDKETGKWGYN